MEIYNADVCDFFAYVQCTGTVAAWRVHRNTLWWAWALPKLKLISHALNDVVVPEALCSRKFHFIPFDYDQLVVKFLFLDNGSSSSSITFCRPLVLEPQGARFEKGEMCFLIPQNEVQKAERSQYHSLNVDSEEELDTMWLSAVQYNERRTMLVCRPPTRAFPIP